MGCVRNDLSDGSEMVRNRALDEDSRSMRSMLNERSAFSAVACGSPSAGGAAPLECALLSVLSGSFEGLLVAAEVSVAAELLSASSAAAAVVGSTSS